MGADGVDNERERNQDIAQPAMTSKPFGPVSDDFSWVDGRLESWWHQLLWGNQLDMQMLPWWMRVDTNRRGFDKKYFVDAYPALAPYGLWPSVNIDWVDPWVCQSYYSAWW